MNARTRERPNLIEHVTFRGDEYLFYPALPLDVVIVRGTHADEDGNLTTDEEVMKLEVLHAVLAARRYGAKVLAQVKYRVAKGSLHPKSITVPGNLIDAIVVCEEPQTDHRQTQAGPSTQRCAAISSRPPRKMRRCRWTCASLSGGLPAAI